MCLRHCKLKVAFVEFSNGALCVYVSVIRIAIVYVLVLKVVYLLMVAVFVIHIEMGLL